MLTVMGIIQQDVTSHDSAEQLKIYNTGFMCWNLLVARQLIFILLYGAAQNTSIILHFEQTYDKLLTKWHVYPKVSSLTRVC